jgi:hypothetical protein
MGIKAKKREPEESPCPYDPDEKKIELDEGDICMEIREGRCSRLECPYSGDICLE